MVRVDQQDDDDDFVEPLPRQRAAAPGKDGDEKCMRRNRASQERPTLMTKGLSNDQKKVARDMGMQSLMNVLCSNLMNHLCDWLGEIYDPASREFVIPGHGRLLLDDESVFRTLGVPCGELIVLYETNNDIEQELFPRLSPDDATMPNKMVLATSLEKMKTHGDVFKMKLLMYLISSVFTPTTSLHPSNICFPILHMNWCKFIADFLHDALPNKMYQKGCRLHLMLMYVDRLDLSTVDLVVVGGLPPPYKFVVSVWTMDVHSAPSCVDARAPVEHLVGQFASGMTNLLGKLVDAWSDQLKSREFLVGDNNVKAPDVVNASKGGNASTVAIDVGVSPSKRGRTTEDLDQGPDDKKRRIDPVAARMRFKEAPTPSRASTRLNKGVLTAIGISSTRSSPHASLSNTSDPVVLEDMRKQSKWVKKTVSRPTKATNKDPLEHIHSKLATSDNVDIHVPPVNKPATAAPNVASSSDAPKHSLAARTAEVVPTLLSMRDATTIPSSRSASDEVSFPELIFNKEDSRSSTDSTHGVAGSAMLTKEGVVAEIPDQRTSTDDFCHTAPTSPPIAQAAPTKVFRVDLPPRRNPCKNPTKESTVVEVVKSRPDMGLVCASTLFTLFEQSKSTRMMEVGITGVASNSANQFMQNPFEPQEAPHGFHPHQVAALGQPSFADPADLVPHDIIRSATPSSVKQSRVIHALVVDDCQPELRATMEQTLLYDIVKHFGNVRASNKYMKQLQEYDCGYYVLEYLAKWEGRKVPTISKASVVELRKILTWNCVTNGDFNKRPSTRDFINEDVKTACKKYK
ncbi:hypothetical protein ZWY2020_019862 [Hordeum vulgare]|nr:hypothetical protein ZWY2020_019862 [Hordeum vulgare]